MKKNVFIASLAALRTTIKGYKVNNEIRHCAFLLWAVSDDEAFGTAYRKSLELWPPSERWEAHDIDVKMINEETLSEIKNTVKSMFLITRLANNTPYGVFSHLDQAKKYQRDCDVYDEMSCHPITEIPVNPKLGG